jgi:hypothetical protein
VTTSCTFSGACEQVDQPKDQGAMLEQACLTIFKGKLGTGCPTEGIVGCCKSSSGGEDAAICFYDAASAMEGRSTLCAFLPNSTWSTSL